MSRQHASHRPPRIVWVRLFLKWSHVYSSQTMDADSVSCNTASSSCIPARADVSLLKPLHPKHSYNSYHWDVHGVMTVSAIVRQQGIV